MQSENFYLFDVGSLLHKTHPEFDKYTHVYDQLHAYYDKCQWYMTNLDDAIKQAKKYVNDGIDGTYVVVSESDTLNIDDEIAAINIPVENETYLASNVIYSIAKINGKIIENFVKKTKRLHITMTYAFIGDTGIDIPVDVLNKETSDTNKIKAAFEYARTHIGEIPVAANATYINDSDSFEFDDIDFNDGPLDENIAAKPSVSKSSDDEITDSRDMNLVNKNNHHMSNEIRIRNISADICSIFEDLLDAHDVTIPDEDRTGDESEARLYGSVYSEIENAITDILSELCKNIKENHTAEINTEEY